MRTAGGAPRSWTKPTERPGAAPAVPRTETARASAWTIFWSEQGADSRCLADAPPETQRGLAEHWTAFAATLAPGTRAIDIGCGAGAVGRTLLAVQPGLRITGVDAARIPPSGDLRLTLLPATPMERLPFDAAVFDAAVSQFGLEYGNVAEAARELARVLVPGAPASFIVHHAHSRIVREGRARSEALRALLGEPVKRAFLSGRAVALDRELLAIREHAPTDALVGEIAGALRRHVCAFGARRGAIWRTLAEALAPERKLLDALLACCVDPKDLAGWLAPFASGFEIRCASPSRRPSGEAIAWRIEAVRSRSR